MLAWVSLPQQWLMTTWNKQMSSILTQKPVAVLSFELRQNTRALKSMYVNCCDFFYAEDFVSRIDIMLLNFTPLQSPDIFYNHASRSRKGKILRWNKQAGQQADLASQCSECSLPANKWKTEGQNGHSPWLWYEPWSRKAFSTLNISVPSDVHLFGFFKEENGQEIFLQFRLDIKKNKS